MNDKSFGDVLQPVDADARARVRHIIDEALFGSLATLDPGTGHPLASRVGVATDGEGAPVFLISALAAHTPALEADPRCSLMLGEPKGGDPLAHPRVSLIGQAVRITGEGERAAVRERYLAKHPKAKLYVDFKDFAFWRLNVERAAFTAGFGKAFAMTASDVSEA